MGWKSFVLGILNAVHTTSGTFGQAVRNIEDETRLPDDFWRRMYDALAPCSTTVACLKTKVTEICRFWILSGPEIPSLHGNTFGRAVEMVDLSEHFRKSGYFATPHKAKSQIRSVQRLTEWELANRWRSYTMGKYLHWATYAERGKLPFDSLTPAIEVRGRLGLNRRKGELVLLQYRLPRGVHPRIPTIADAYAGEWFYFFRPAREGSVCGYTMPWHEYEYEPQIPEVVHEVIWGDSLQSVRVLPG